MTVLQRQIVLASASPRRRALLEALGIAIDVVVSNVDEHVDGTPDGVAIHNACLKRDAVLESAVSNAIVIAADTVVAIDGTLLGKPADLDEARAMIRQLAGRTHEVVTGVAVGGAGGLARHHASATTRVTFRDLHAGEIDAFVEAVRPLDRAGAYTVDGPGSLLVARYDGCFYNVLGLPLVTLDDVLRKSGISLFDLMDGTKAAFL